MSGDDVLKEFIVKLGWKVDEAGQKKMKEGVQDATKLVNELGLAIDLSLAGMTAFAVKTSEALDKMYYASQRTGSAVQDMKAFDYAMSQTGGTADGAQASLENLAHFIRSYPGSEQFLQRLGVQPDHVHDAAKALEDLGKTFQRMPFWQAQPYANMLGIDEKTLLSLQSGEFNKYLDDYNQRLRDVGIDEQEAAVKGHKFAEALRGLKSDADLTGEALVSGPFGTALMWLVDMLDKAVKGWNLLLANPQASAQSLTENAIDTTEAVSKYFPTGTRARTVLEDERLRHALGTHDKTRAMGPKQQRNIQADDAKAFFMRQGWTDAQAAGIVGNLFAESGLDANAQNQSGMYGLAQWDTKRRNAFKEWSGHDIHGSAANEQLAFIQHELETSQKRAASLLGAANTPEDAAATFNEEYERSSNDPVQLARNSRLRGGYADSYAGTTIHQETNIHVTGTDPGSTANLVQSKQNDVNNQLVRNIGPVVQ